jgi:hypothetical protein
VPSLCTLHCAEMTEKAEAWRVPSNILRTLPYTAYTATLAHGIVFGHAPSLHLFGALIVNELSNHAAKAALKKAYGKEHPEIRRPDGAMDTGIYPQHRPQLSKSSGMPSGHSQTAWFLATVLSASSGGRRSSQLFLFAVAALVTLSRTRHGGMLSIAVDGEVKACHTVNQVLLGAAIGMLLGWLCVLGYFR